MLGEPVGVDWVNVGSIQTFTVSVLPAAPQAVAVPVISIRIKSVAPLFAAVADCNGARLVRVWPAMPLEVQSEMFGFTVLTLVAMMLGMPMSIYSVPPGEVDVVEAPLRNITLAWRKRLPLADVFPPCHR